MASKIPLSAIPLDTHTLSLCLFLSLWHLNHLWEEKGLPDRARHDTTDCDGKMIGIIRKVSRTWHLINNRYTENNAKGGCEEALDTVTP